MQQFRLTANYHPTRPNHTTYIGTSNTLLLTVAVEWRHWQNSDSSNDRHVIFYSFEITKDRPSIQKSQIF